MYLDISMYRYPDIYQASTFQFICYPSGFYCTFPYLQFHLIILILLYQTISHGQLCPIHNMPRHPDPDIGVQTATSREIHTVSSSEDDMDVVSLSGSPQELLSTRNNDAPVVNIASDSDGNDSVVEFQPNININTVDRSDDDSGLADMVGGPGLGYAEDNSETSTSSIPSAPSAVLPWTDLRFRTTSRGMSQRQEALRSERS